MVEGIVVSIYTQIFHEQNIWWFHIVHISSNFKYHKQFAIARTDRGVGKTQQLNNLQ